MQIFDFVNNRFTDTRADKQFYNQVNCFNFPNLSEIMPLIELEAEGSC